MMNDDDDEDMNISMDDGMDDTGFDDFGEKSSGTLGTLLRENPMAKLGVVAVGAAVLFGLVSIMGSSEEPAALSVIPRGEEIKAAPGSGEVTPAMRQAIEEANEQRHDEAVLLGTSSLPTPIDPPTGIAEDTGLPLDGSGLPIGLLSPPMSKEEKKEDPLARWEKLQAERKKREAEENANKAAEEAVSFDLLQFEQQQISQQQQEEARRKAVQVLAESMSQQMQIVLESTSGTSTQYMMINDPSYLEALQAEEEAEAAEIAAQQAAEGLTPEAMKQILPAGEILYAQLVTEANSDVPGPVVVDIVSGPLKGSRALGSFKVQKEYLSLNFDTVIIDEVSYTIDAVALDPATTLPGMATEVDHRYLQRIILPMAASFVEGFAEAIANTGLTDVSVQGETVAEETKEASTKQQVGSGIEEAGAELRDILDEKADSIKILVKIAAGTPMGILFLEPVAINE